MVGEQSQSADARLDAIEGRLARIESLLTNIVSREGASTSGGPVESPAPPWKHLVVRGHPWRKQLYIKGRNMTVRHLIGSVIANQLTEEEGAKDHDLPVEAIREALAYAEQNPEVLALDHAYENYLLARGGNGRGPQSLP